MDKANTDNLETLENVSSPASNSPNTDDFFDTLDRQVNKGILEPESESVITNATTEENVATSETSPTNSTDNEHNWEKRYKDSTSEARRLNTRNKELETYAPILDAMRKDPNLIKHVQGYFAGGGKTPKSIKEQLGLDEDFVFDADEAVSDSKSDSAKVLQGTIDGAVSRKVTALAKRQSREADKQVSEKSFREKHELNDEQWADFVDFAQSRVLSLDDIYYLKNRDSRDKNVASSARKDISDQMRRVRQKPQSAASTGSSDKVEISEDDQVFDSLMGIDNELEKAFGFNS